MFRLAILFSATLLLTACAAPEGANDPYESTNRAIFGFNLTIDRLALRPTAERYQTYVPEEVRDSLRGALDNLRSPVIFANDLMQGETGRAGDTLGRFLVNSTLGLGGLFDVATRHGLMGHEEDFGQTLGAWGVGEGPYIVLPLLGPSNPRDAFGLAADQAMDPTHYIRIKRHMFWIGAREYLNIVDTRARSLEAFDAIERDSLDFYAAARSLARQHRASEIRNGRPPPPED